MVQIPPALTRRLTEIEATAPSWLDEHPLAAELETLVPDVVALTNDERLGCFAEIVGHRFVPNMPPDRSPWDSYFGPTASGTDKNGNEVHMPDAKQVDAEVIEYWKARARQTPHPILRARYADLAWEVSRIWNREHPDRHRIERPRELAQLAADAYLDSAALADSAEPVQLFMAWRYLSRALELAIFVKDATLVERAKKAAFDFNRINRATGHTGQWWLIDDQDGAGASVERPSPAPGA
ncbi:hypothetical protein GTP58_08375 [Duganella sp. CY15W]|uniref:DUF7380 domain-containing protein n=1 Tax=Duganella sp. CY15W TaxID=2692172 RepID=UPI00136F7386|nr:hypothetical protein [Duganella sp. CY15W]MYM28337.1 hypothetical protein [Duganella sp. CY15W]